MNINKKISRFEQFGENMSKKNLDNLPNFGPVPFPSNGQYDKSVVPQITLQFVHSVSQMNPNPCQKASQQQFESIHQDRLKKDFIRCSSRVIV